MKIRLFGDSIRLRLTQVEVQAIAAGGTIESVIPFPGEALACTVQPSTGPLLEARHQGGRITILVPPRDAAHWAASEDEGLYSTGVLRIALEKDYRCIHKPDSPDNAGTFPNPLAPNGD